MRVAQIGVGYWGPNLLRNLAANPDIEVLAVADLLEQRRSLAAEITPAANLVQSSDEVINNSDVEAVVIATPATTHYDLVDASLRAGKHVLVEKPIAMSSQGVRELGQLAAESRLVLMVGHTFLYNQAVITLKELVSKGELGDLRYISSQRLNLGRIRGDVDAAWNLAPHDLSIIQFLLNDAEPQSVQRLGKAYIQDGIDDVVFLHVEYPNDVMAHIHVSWLDPHKIRRVTVVGSERMAVYDDMAEHKIALHDTGIDPIARIGERMDYDQGSFEAFRHRSGDVLLPAIRNLEPLRAQVEHWVECIREGAPCRSGPQQGEMVTRILEMSNGAHR